MVTVRCDFHAGIAARWRCTQCHKNLCTQCAPKGVREAAPACPVCRATLTSLGMGNTIKPFWERIPRFFLYPANPAPLATVLALAVLSMAAVIPLVGIAALIAVAVMTVRYCYRVLYHTALGNLDPPEFAQGGKGHGMFWKQIVLVALLFGGAMGPGIALHSTVVLFAGAAVAFLLLPAAVMTLAVEQSLLAAINPIRLILVAVVIGWPYLLLWVMLLLLTGGEHQLLALMPAKLSPLLQIFVYHFVSIYFSIAMFHMMGYVVYQYHEPLGFHAAREYTESAEGVREIGKLSSAQPAPDRAHMLIADGNFAEAEAELVAQLKREPDDLRLHDRYNRLLLTQDDPTGKGAAHADLYIGKLLMQAQRDKALDAYRRGVARWGGIEIKDAADTIALARFAHERNESKLALPMLGRFAQRFPGHTAIPEALLLTAQILSHGLGRDQMALQIVEQLRRVHPEHALRPQMDALHATLSRIVQRPPSATAQT